MTRRQKQWLLRILSGGLIGIAALIPVGGLLNDLVNGGLIAIGNHTPFQLVSPDLQRLAGSAALAVQLGLYFLMGAVVGVSTLPFADDGPTLVRRSLTHFAATAGALALLVCLCGWNWGQLAPLIVYLLLLAAVYLLIWAARWVGWYAEVTAIREKLGLAAGPSPLKWRETLTYLPFALALCLALPALLRALDAPDVPVLSGILYPVLLSVGSFFSGLFLARRRGFCPLYPVLCGLLLIPVVLLLYNATALFYSGASFLAALAGEMAGLTLRIAGKEEKS